ncbi:hypothetical protein BC831DRAFT_477978 [Entophlyctis helioformis]|nr:hypothetical protein BC831DRAFT_477978 [Entophlyctis helioformis]
MIDAVVCMQRCTSDTAADAGHGAARPPSSLSLSPSHSHSEPPPELAPTPRPGRKRGAVEDCTEGGVKRLRSGQDVASSMTVMFATTSSTVGLVATAASAPLPTPSVAAAAEAAAVSPASNAAGEASSSLALPPPSSPPSSPPPPLLPQLDQVEQHEQEPQPMLPRVRLADDASIRPMLPRSVRRRIEYIAPVSARRHVQARMRVRERSRQRRSNTGDGASCLPSDCLAALLTHG